MERTYSLMVPRCFSTKLQQHLEGKVIPDAFATESI